MLYDIINQNKRREEVRTVAENKGTDILGVVEARLGQQSAYDYNDEHHDDDESATSPEDYDS